MKILYTGFKGKNNASCQLVELINANDKVLLTNSFEGIKKDLAKISLLFHLIRIEKLVIKLVMRLVIL